MTMKRKPFDDMVAEADALEERWRVRGEGAHDADSWSRWFSEATAVLTDWGRQGRFMPLASAERRALRSMLERWATRLDELGHGVDGLDTLDNFDPNAGVVLDVECPYPGLSPYQGNDAHKFFGREVLIDRVCKHLAAREGGHRIMALVGPSGSGKSSLALAGVIPKLMREHAQTWLFAPRMTPGTHPMARLAHAVAAAVGQPGIEPGLLQALNEGPDRATEILGQACHGQSLVLLVDQFEEIFTLGERNPVEQRAFATALVALSEPSPANDGFVCRTLLTLRLDYQPKLDSDVFLALHRRLVSERNKEDLGPVSFGEIRRAIQKPADEVGLRFIPASLVDELANQTGGMSNGLPLLQFSLRLLWRRRPRDADGRPLDLITKEMVDALPSVQEALGQVAEGLYRGFTRGQQGLCERLIQELLVLDDTFEEPLRRSRNEERLLAVIHKHFPDPADARHVIDAFISAQLLIRSGQGTAARLEVAHEALLRQWQRIRDLIAKGKARLLLIKEVDKQAAEWLRNERYDEYLVLRGERLKLAFDYCTDEWVVADGSKAYVDACTRREAAEKRSQQLAQRNQKRAFAWRFAVGVTAVMGLILGAMGWQSAGKSFDQSLLIAAQAETLRNPQLGLMLGLEAARNSGIAGLAGTEGTLRTALRANSTIALISAYGGASITANALSPDGDLLASGDNLGGIALWEVHTGVQRAADYPHAGPVTALVFSRERRWLASGGEDGRIVIWDLRAGNKPRVIAAHAGKIGALAFSRPTGQYLATGGQSDGQIRIWETASGKELKRLQGHYGGIKALAYGRDENQLVSAGDDERVVHWDPMSGTAFYSQAIVGLQDIDVSDDGARLAIAAENVSIWDPRTRARVLDVGGHHNTVLHARFSNDRKRLITCNSDGTIQVWRMPQDGEAMSRVAVAVGNGFYAPPRAVVLNNLTIDDRGEVIAALATFRGRSEVTIWSRVHGGELKTWTAGDAPIRQLLFGPGDQHLLVTDDFGHLSQWTMEARQVELPPGVPTNDSVVGGMVVALNGISATADGVDVLVQHANGAPPLRLKRHVKTVNQLVISADATRLVSVDLSGATAIVWDATIGQHLFDVTAAEVASPVRTDPLIGAVAISPQGDTLAITDQDGTLHLVSMKTGKRLERQFEQKSYYERHALAVNDLVFSSDGRLLFSGGQDKVIGVWDVEQTRFVEFLYGHRDGIQSLAVDRGRLASASDDGVRLWDISQPSRKLLSEFSNGTEGARRVAFSHDGKLLAAGSADGTVRMYLTGAAELARFAQSRIPRAWTAAECEQFGFGGRAGLWRRCPTSRFDAVSKANEAFASGDIKAGQQFLLEGLADQAMAKETEAESAKRVQGYVMNALSQEVRSAATNGAAGNKSPEWDELKATYRKLSAWISADPDTRIGELRAFEIISDLDAVAAKGDVAAIESKLKTASNLGLATPDTPRLTAARMVAVAAAWVAHRNLRDLAKLEPRWLDQLRAGVDADSAFAPGQGLLGWFAATQQDLTTAQARLREQARLWNSAEPLADLAQWLTDEKQPKLAIVFAKEAIKKDSNYGAAHYSLGVALMQQTEWKQAVAALDNVPSSSDLYKDAINGSAAILFENLHDVAGAKRRFLRGLQDRPDDVALQANYAELLLAVGEPQAAMNVATQVLGLRAEVFADLADTRAAMSLVQLSAAVMMNHLDDAAVALKQIEAFLQTPATFNPEDKWSFDGIRRALRDRWKLLAPDLPAAMEQAFDYVDSSGKSGSLEPIRLWLKSRRPGG